MSFLVDTHTLLWWLFNDRRLSRRARAVLADPENRIVVSAASAWEISIKHRLGRLDSAGPLLREFSLWMEKAGFVELPVTHEHAIRAGAWEIAHRDPFDRMLAAQSTLDGLRLVSRDPVFADFGLEPLW
jgi:PIN domain nuclease of toxin-antitoxin system